MLKLGYFRKSWYIEVEILKWLLYFSRQGWASVIRHFQMFLTYIIMKCTQFPQSSFCPTLLFAAVLFFFIQETS